VHQDGLVHISHLSDTFIKDPREAVKAGDMVKVKVLEVDVARKRIALSMKSEAVMPVAKTERATTQPSSNKKVKAPAPAPQSSMANAFAKALKK